MRAPPPSRPLHRRPLRPSSSFMPGISRPARTRWGPRTPFSWSTSSPATSPLGCLMLWPSTGNYGIGGSWVGPRMGYEVDATGRRKMSAERFEEDRRYGSLVLSRRPGRESNVKEIYDECKRLAANPRVRIMNQFAEMANYRWHYHVTGAAAAEAVETLGAAGRPLSSRPTGICCRSLAWVSASSAPSATRIVGFSRSSAPCFSSRPGCRAGMPFQGTAYSRPCGSTT